MSWHTAFSLPPSPASDKARPRMGTLFYGDNLDILRGYVADASVNLVYLFLPFNSAQNYNAFLQQINGTAAAQFSLCLAS